MSPLALTEKWVSSSGNRDIVTDGPYLLRCLGQLCGALAMLRG
jgi:hypothetical protein